MQALLGKKLGMTQIFDEKTGEVTPVTVIQVGPCPVVQVKTTAEHGYEAVQIGFGDIRSTVVNLPTRGHYAKAKVVPRRMLREFRVEDASGYTVGQELTVEMFQDAKVVDVIGTSKGRGFAGTVKRHKFHTGPRTHGSRNYRAPGSIGSNSTPNRVFKGQRMPGHHGDVRVTVRNVAVAQIDAANNLILVGGAVPGCRNGFVLVRSAKKPR
jgi:large subunit ribosomal protein L3